MCKNETCPKRKTCHRFTARPSQYQSYFLGLAPDADGNCRYYWPSDNPNAYREFLKRKRAEVESWPAEKREAAEAAFAPKIESEES